MDRGREERRASDGAAAALGRVGQAVLPGRGLLQAARAAGGPAAVFRPLPAGEDAAAAGLSPPRPPPTTRCRAMRCVTTSTLFYEERPTPERARAAIAAYYACITFMDEQLGRVLDALERLGLRDNTVIVLWGDHGWHLGEKGMWAKGTLFDVAARAPLIIVDPRRKTAGQACPRTVEFVDIYPRWSSFAAWPMPPGLEGKSLAAAAGQSNRCLGQAGLHPGGPRRLAGTLRADRAMVLHRMGRRPSRRGALRSSGRSAGVEETSPETAIVRPSSPN